MVLGLGLLVCGCKAITEHFSQRLTHWKMLGDDALEDPVKAVGGDALVFVPRELDRPLSRQQLRTAPPETLVSYYSPVFVQQRIDTRAQRFPYPPEYDTIGEARLKREPDGKLKSYVTGQPKVYAICKQTLIEGRPHFQLTYTAWYPAHPRMKTLDVEEADIDSCVLRVTLDTDNAPLFYETIAACGCFHKVFLPRRLEMGAREAYGTPQQGKKYCAERVVENAVDWEVAGLVDEPPDQPRRPVVFLKAGDHKVIGMGSTARLRMPAEKYSTPYEMTSYADLYAVAIDGTQETAAFFDMDAGGKVRGGERKRERFLMSFIGVEDAGRPRTDDQIKLHFDQSTWNDPTAYGKFLRLAPGAL